MAKKYNLIKRLQNNYKSKVPYKNKFSTSFMARRNRFKHAYVGGKNNLISGDPFYDYGQALHINRPEFYHLVSSVTTDYFEGNTVTTTTNYSYDNLTGYLKNKEVKTSDDNVLLLKNTYPSSGILKDENRISTPIKVETFKNGVPISTQETIYGSFQNGSLYLPNFIKTLKGKSSSTNKIDDRVVYHAYDNKGNPTEVSKKGGTRVVYIWGYNQSYPIAKIDNATYSDVKPYESKLLTLSNQDKDSASEKLLRAALNTLRTKLPNSQVTTYTYDPLVGVTSITDSRGETTYYEYDDFNRLLYVKDKDGNILKEHKYKYKNN